LLKPQACQLHEGPQITDPRLPDDGNMDETMIIVPGSAS
jgi:hypothetical protein